MLKFLHKELDWETVKAVGFDLDGTLYDEYEFIAQVYRPIAMKLIEATGDDFESMYSCLLQRWLEKGSSYNRLFDEVLIEARVPVTKRSQLIASCLSEFRNFQPQLCLPARVAKILDWASTRFPLFLVTDGSEKLQQAKIDTLGLIHWIRRDNISISGCIRRGIGKPDVRMSLPVKILQDTDVQPRNVIYFGDRDVDAAFATNCGYQFVQVKLMMPIV
jgi:FMN phosphatase YigB (HAD superfamily)